MARSRKPTGRKARMMTVLASIAEDSEAAVASRVRAAEIVLAYEDGKPATKKTISDVRKGLQTLSNEEIAMEIQRAAKATEGVAE